MTKLDAQIDALPITKMGRLMHRLFPYRRQVILANITQVFQTQLNQAQKTKLLQAYYSHLLLSLKEALQLRFMREDTLRQRVQIIGHEKMLDLYQQQKGILILTGHLGNWEFAPLGGILSFKEFKGQFHFIRRQLGFKALERLIFQRYYQAGLHVIPKKNALNQACKALEAQHAVIFVLDQHASLVNKDGIAVEFFGKKAGTYRSLAMLARHTGAPVVPAAGYRLDNGQHVLEFFDPISWKEEDNSQEALYRNTLAYNQALEKMILAHPEQWNWMHKRWKI